MIILIVGLFFIELEILAIISVKSGEKTWLHVQDERGNLVYQIEGKKLSENDKKYIERTFGPIEKYQVKLTTKNYPFPFRAWFVTAVGVPIGFILLLGFIVRAYFSFFYRDEMVQKSPTSTDIRADIQYDSKFEKLFGMISRLNIFTIGFLVFLSVFSYWVIPNLVIQVGRVSIDTIVKYKWFFLVATSVVLGIFLWIIYLRYLLAKKSIESRTDLDKYRLELEYKQHSPSTLQLEYGNGGNDSELIEMDEIKNDTEESNLMNKNKE